MKKILSVMMVFLFMASWGICAENGAVSASNSGPLELTVKAGKAEYAAGEPILVIYRIHNISDSPVMIANTPVSDEITFDPGNGAAPVVQTHDYGLPDKDDNFILFPNESKRRQVDLSLNNAVKGKSGTWNFRISEVYGVAKDSNSGNFQGPLTSNVITFKVNERISPAPKTVK